LLKKYNLKHTTFYYEDFANDSKHTTLSAFRALTGHDMQNAFDCPISKSSDTRDVHNVEELRRKLAC